MRNTHAVDTQSSDLLEARFSRWHVGCRDWDPEVPCFELMPTYSVLQLGEAGGLLRKLVLVSSAVLRCHMGRTNVLDRD